MHARLLFCLEQQQHEARRNCGTDHTRHIRAHCVHEQEVGGVGFAAFLLGDTRRHWNSGNTSRADQGVYLAFCNVEHQLAQKIAESGVDVLYFALEMGRDEFVARGISSLSFQHNRDSKNKQLTAANILYWTYDELLGDFTKLAYSQYEQYSEEYFSKYGSHLHIIESGLDGLTVKDIANLAAVFKKRKSNSVVVFVDYLQIIKADPEDRSQSDRKTKMDVVVTTLKTLASQIGMPVVTVSSISRANYSGTIGTSAFKESGDTEYTGGVLIGWNWSGVTDQKDKSKQNEEKVL